MLDKYNPQKRTNPLREGEFTGVITNVSEEVRNGYEVVVFEVQPTVINGSEGPYITVQHSVFAPTRESQENAFANAIGFFCDAAGVEGKPKPSDFLNAEVSGELVKDGIYFRPQFAY